MILKSLQATTLWSWLHFANNKPCFTHLYLLHNHPCAFHLTSSLLLYNVKHWMRRCPNLCTGSNELLWAKPEQSGFQAQYWLTLFPSVETYQEEVSTGNLTQHPTVVLSVNSSCLRLRWAQQCFPVEPLFLCSFQIYATAQLQYLKHTYLTVTVLNDLLLKTASVWFYIILFFIWRIFCWFKRIRSGERIFNFSFSHFAFFFIPTLSHFSSAGKHWLTPSPCPHWGTVAHTDTQL